MRDTLRAHRALPHQSRLLGVVRPESMACRSTEDGIILMVLDRSARKLHLLRYRTKRGFDAVIRTIELTRVLKRSDQPLSIASTATGIALGGVFVSGARFLWTTNDSVWHYSGGRTTQTDSSTSFFLRVAEGTQVVADPQSERVIATETFSPLMWRTDAINRGGRVLRYGSGSSPNLTLRQGEEGEWRLHWDQETRLRSKALASAVDIFAILDCDCGVRDRPPEWTAVVLGRFSDSTLRRVILVGKPSTIAIDADKKTLLGSLGEPGAERLFTWDIGSVIAGRGGGGERL